MRSDEIEQGLFASIVEHDPYKVSKQLQIKQWIHLCGFSLLRSSFSDELQFVAQVIGNDECWDRVSGVEQVKLNRSIVGKKLLESITVSGEENPFNNMQKYKIACLCCFEDKIRELWDEAQAELTRAIPIERQLNSTYAGHGPIVTYWSHYINGYMDKFKKDFKREGDNNDLHGFESAVRSKNAEALEFFWQRLTPVLSSEEKDELLIYTATYYDVIVGRANSDMVDFAMNHLDESKYHQLLKKDFEKNEEYSTLSTLRRSYLFDRAEELFKCLKQEDITNDDYSTAMYAALSSIVSVPDDQSFISAGYKMLSTMWNIEGIEANKQFFINRLSYGLSSAGSEIAQLVKTGRVSEILSEIIGSLSIKQITNLWKLESWVYEILKTANLFSDDVMKHLIAIEQASVNKLENQEELMVLGADSGIDNQKIANA